MINLETFKRPLRMVKHRLLRERRDSGTSAPVTILDAYSKALPSNQEAINIFAGEWASRLPADSNVQAGHIDLFVDERIRLGLHALGGVANQSVLELGPLEGGHSYQLEKAGAQSVLAIEANTRAYLKCLVAKEITGMQRVKFVCGDFMAYLRQSPPRFDFILASGVLYHQSEPVELIHRLSQITNRMLIWTHYYDEAIIRSIPHLKDNFQVTRESEYAGFTHSLHQQEYRQAINNPGFCGAGRTYSYWLERQTILDALKHVGFNSVQVLQEDTGFVNGPCFLLAVQRVV